MRNHEGHAKNIFKNYINDEDLEQHERRHELIKRYNRFAHLLSEIGSHVKSLTEVESLIVAANAQKETLRMLLAEPTLASRVHALMTSLARPWSYTTQDLKQQKIQDFLLELVEYLGSDALGESLVSRVDDPEFLDDSGYLTLINVLFMKSKATYQTRQLLVTAMLNRLKKHDDAESIGALLRSINRTDQPVVREYMAEVLEKYHLPDEPFVDVWRFNEQDKASGYELETDHFLAVKRLEGKDPGICLFLWKNFGIVNFGRYPDEVLLQQRKQFENVGPYGIIMYARDDHNGAFNRPYLIKDMAEQAGDALNLRIMEVQDLIGAVRMLIRLHQQYFQKGLGHKIQFALFGGHGTSDCIQLGNDYQQGYQVVSDDLNRAGGERLRNFFEEDAVIILQSCSTGMEDGIGQKLSALLSNIIVIAPMTPTNIGRVTLVQENTDTWKINAEFRDEKSKNTYQNGKSAAKIG